MPFNVFQSFQELLAKEYALNEIRMPVWLKAYSLVQDFWKLSVFPREWEDDSLGLHVGLWYIHRFQSSNVVTLKAHEYTISLLGALGIYRTSSLG